MQDSPSQDSVQQQIEARVQMWLAPPFDDSTQAQVREWIKSDQSELQDAFWKDLEFGTGGMRGFMGVGSSRMNAYNVQRATQGLCNWIQKEPYQGRRRAVIAYDSRHQSKSFAWSAARVFAANQIEVYLFNELRPTPMLSFAVRHLKADCGIMITASHNPPQYNGFKIYNSEGCQYYLPDDEQIVQSVDQVRYSEIATNSSNSDSLIHGLDEAIDRDYLKAIQMQRRCPEVDQHMGGGLCVVYSSLHGTGITLVPQALSNWGFSQLLCVDAQSKPDGNFPTVTAPNPEDSSALELGIQQLLAHQADILIANDPDGDRMGVAIRHEGRSRIFNGQEIAILLADHLLEHSSLRTSPPPAIIKSLVTTPLIEKLAAAKGVALFNVLPGFKYFGRLIAQWESDQSHHFLFGAEESHGYLAGLHARDKDGVVAACLISEAALQCKLQGINLADRLEAIYRLHGRYGHRLITISQSETMEGRRKLQQTMGAIRENAPAQLGNHVLLQVVDLLSDHVKEPLLKADVLIWELDSGSQVIIRPSGTEPKIKIYISAYSTGDELQSQSQLNELELQLRALFK